MKLKVPDAKDPEDLVILQGNENKFVLSQVDSDEVGPLYSVIPTRKGKIIFGA